MMARMKVFDTAWNRVESARQTLRYYDTLPPLAFDSCRKQTREYYEWRLSRHLRLVVWRSSRSAKRQSKGNEWLGIIIEVLW